MSPNEGVRQTSEAYVICISPDVCLTCGVPVPYPIIAYFDNVFRQVTNVRMTGMATITMASRVTTVIGDASGVGGGVMCGINLGCCIPITHNGTVRANNNFVIYHSSEFWMNCSGPDEKFGNTKGKVYYIKYESYICVGPAGEIVGDTCPPVVPENNEVPWYKWLGQQYVEYNDALQEGRVETLKEWGSSFLSLVQFAADTTPLGGLGSIAKKSFKDLPSWIPDQDRAAGKVISTVGSAASFLWDTAPSGIIFDKLNDAGVPVPAWLPSSRRAEKKIEGVIHHIVDPYVDLIKNGHYGKALGKAQAGTEKIAAEIVITEGIGEFFEGARVVEGFVEEAELTEEIGNGLRISRTAVGELGEKAVIDDLIAKGYEDVVQIQNASGHGIDVVAKGADGKLHFFEVKSNTTGKIGSLGAAQKDALGFIKDRLKKASAQEGKWSGVDAATAQRATDLLEEIEGGAEIVPHKADVFLDETGNVKDIKYGEW
jgi:hypothetical protein